MIQEAKRTAPTTEFLVGDFLGESLDAQIFHGICVKAVLHLLMISMRLFFGEDEITSD